MPLFYFNVFADDVSIDSDGKELAGIGDAFTHAGVFACSLASETAARGYVAMSHYVEIADHAHKRVGRVLVGEAIEIRQ